MSKFEIVSKFKPSGDQPDAINSLVNGINSGKKEQILKGVTGSGKTFTMANIIAETNKPTLVLAHNKTLAGQLYSEFKELFPNNHVEYLFHIMITTYQNHIFRKVIHISKKIRV